MAANTLIKGVFSVSMFLLLLSSDKIVRQHVPIQSSHFKHTLMNHCYTVHHQPNICNNTESHYEHITKSLFDLTCDPASSPASPPLSELLHGRVASVI